MHLDISKKMETWRKNDGLRETHANNIESNMSSSMELSRRSCSFPRSPPKTILLWWRHNQYSQQLKQAPRLFFPRTLNMYIDDVHFCRFCPFPSHASPQCPALSPRIRATLISTREVSLHQYQDTLDGSSRELFAKDPPWIRVTLCHMRSARSTPRGGRSLLNNKTCR